MKEASLASSSHSEAKEIGDREESHGADVESADAFSLSDQQASASSELAASDEPDPEKPTAEPCPRKVAKTVRGSETSPER